MNMLLFASGCSDAHNSDQSATTEYLEKRDKSGTHWEAALALNRFERAQMTTDTALTRLGRSTATSIEMPATLQLSKDRLALEWTMTGVRGAGEALPVADQSPALGDFLALPSASDPAAAALLLATRWGPMWMRSNPVFKITHHLADGWISYPLPTMTERLRGEVFSEPIANWLELSTHWRLLLEVIVELNRWAQRPSVSIDPDADLAWQTLFRPDEQSQKYRGAEDHSQKYRASRTSGYLSDLLELSHTRLAVHWTDEGFESVVVAPSLLGKLSLELADSAGRSTFSRTCYICGSQVENPRKLPSGFVRCEQETCKKEHTRKVDTARKRKHRNQKRRTR